MRNAPKISVIMPAYNSGKYVAKAMDSIIDQTFDDWELIAVDDGSADNTGTVIDEYAAKDSRIRPVHTENRGVSHARNTGLDMAAGEWVAFLDSDDMYEADAFEVMLGESVGADLVMGNFRLEPETGEHSKIQTTKRYNDFRETGSDFGEYIKTGVLNVVWGKLFRRDIINTRFCEGCDHGEDGLFLISLLGAARQIGFIAPCVYVHRRGDGNSLSHQFDDEYVNTVETIAKFYIDYFDDARIIESIYANYLRGIIGDIRMLINSPVYDDDYTRKYISAFVRSDFLRQIPLAQYPFTPYGQRMATLLLIGDVDMIMEESRKSRESRGGQQSKEKSEQKSVYPLLAAQDKWCADGQLDKSIVKEILVTDSLHDSEKSGCENTGHEEPEYEDTGYEKSWDVSEKQDGSIRAYLMNGGEKVVIAGNGTGKILAGTSIRKMFAGFTALEKITGLGDVLDTCLVADMSYAFHHCIALRELDLSNWDVSAVTNFRGTFCCGYNQMGNAELIHLDISGWDVSAARDMAYMFYGCGKLRTIDVSGWDVSHVENFRHTFADCFCLRELDVSRWDTRSVITLDGIFNDCRELRSIDISSWDTSSCREFDQMFDKCISLREIRGISQIETGNGISFEEMFFGCRRLRSLDLSSVNTDRVDGTEFTAYASSIKSKSTVRNMLAGCNDLREIKLSPSLLRSLCGGANRKNVLLDKIDEVGYIVVSPKTGSMMPMLRPDRDQVAFYAQDRYRKGDIVLFKSSYSSSLVMHRVYRILSNGYLIKGDGDRHAEFVPVENVYAGARQIYRDGWTIPKRSIRFRALSLYSRAYNSMLARYRFSDHVLWRAARRIKRKIF